MYFLYVPAKIMFLRELPYIEESFHKTNYEYLFGNYSKRHYLCTEIQKRYEPVLNYNIQYAQCCMGQQDLMRPFHSARTLVQRIHLTTLQFTFYYFALPLPRKGGRNAVYGVSIRKNRTNLCIHQKEEENLCLQLYLSCL